MALQQMVFSARLVDANGRSRACHAYYEISDTITVATLLGHLEGFASDIAGVTDAAITRLSLSVEDPTYSTANSGTAPIEQTGLLNFLTTGSTRRWSLAIPALKNSKLIGDRINLADGAVTTLINDFTGGAFTNDHYQALTTFADALVSFRRDRKQLQRSSFETA
jgi:hypothetical protein